MISEMFPPFLYFYLSFGAYAAFTLQVYYAALPRQLHPLFSCLFPTPLYFCLLYETSATFPRLFHPLFSVQLITFNWMVRHFTYSRHNNALSNCLSSWIIHEYMVVVVTDAQAYYYIDVLYIVASSQFADFAVPVSYSESIINVNLAIWPLFFTKCNTFLCPRN